MGNLTIYIGSADQKILKSAKRLAKKNNDSVSRIAMDAIRAYIAKEPSEDEYEWKWLAGAIESRRKGLLRKELGVKTDERISPTKLEQAKRMGGTTEKRARFAEKLGKSAQK